MWPHSELEASLGYLILSQKKKKKCVVLAWLYMRIAPDIQLRHEDHLAQSYNIVRPYHKQTNLHKGMEHNSLLY